MSLVQYNTSLSSQTPLLFAEFFAGIGLMRMGLELSGWKVAFANDIDPAKEEAYKRHFKDEQSHFHLGDIHSLPKELIPTVSLATASFPCTDLSHAGRRQGLEGKQSSAFWGFIRVLREMGNRKPPFVLLENVVGFLTSKDGRDFHDALVALNKLGYAVDPFIVDAKHFVPQSRVRLFILGKLRTEVNIVEEKQLAFYQNEIRPRKLAEFICDHPEIDWDLSDLPPLPKSPLTLSDIVENIPDKSGLWWSKERVDYLLNQTFDRHRFLIEEAKGKRKTTYFTAFRRVREGKSMAEIRSDGIAGCLRTPKGGSAKQILLRVGNGKISVRLLSPRECARLMGADDYNISGNSDQDLFGFGDAVCVPVVSWIAENYLNPLLEKLSHQKTLLNELLHAS